MIGGKLKLHQLEPCYLCHIIRDNRDSSTRDIHPMLFQCCATVCDAGPTIKQHQVNFPCFLWICEYCFTSPSAQSWQYCDTKKPEAGTMPFSYRMTSLVDFSAQYHRQQCPPLNSLEHCIGTTPMTKNPTGIGTQYSLSPYILASWTEKRTCINWNVCGDTWIWIQTPCWVYITLSVRGPSLYVRIWRL